MKEPGRETGIHIGIRLADGNAALPVSRFFCSRDEYLSSSAASKAFAKLDCERHTVKQTVMLSDLYNVPWSIHLTYSNQAFPLRVKGALGWGLFLGIGEDCLYGHRCQEQGLG